MSLARRLADRPGVPHAMAAATILQAIGGTYASGGGSSGRSRACGRYLGGVIHRTFAVFPGCVRRPSKGYPALGEAGPSPIAPSSA